MKFFTPIYKPGKNLRPPDLYEYAIDNFWFRTAGMDGQSGSEPLRGSHTSDIVILGGGFSGLSAAFNIHKKFPEKKIVLLEGAACGYGASGRNGGFCITTALLNWEETDPELRSKDLEVSKYGLEQIKMFVSDYGVDCDLKETGMLLVAMNEQQTQDLREYCSELKSFGLHSSLLIGDDLEQEIISPLFVSGLSVNSGATLNPAKLARGMKEVVEGLGVEIRERTVVTRITPGKINHIDTELGEISAPILVMALNAYGHKIGFLKNRVFPVSVFQIATEPLSRAQWDSIGWSGGQGLSDLRTLFSYSIPTADGRIVMGGSDFTYYGQDSLSSGNDKSVTEKVIDNLFSFFPQLEGLKIAHSWGGTTAYTLGRKPSVGVTGTNKNIYYATGFNEGVPSTQTGGRMIAELMAGENNIFTNHFITNSKIHYAGPTAVRGFFGRIVKWMMQNLDYSPIH